MQNTHNQNRRMSSGDIEIESGLARLLAGENLTIQHDVKAQSASFNVDTRTLTMPAFAQIDADFYEMNICHEVGHAMFTPKSDVIGQTISRIDKDTKAADKVKYVVNTVEDARVNRLVKRKYPGVAITYRNAGDYLMGTGMFGDLAEVKVDDYGFLDRINLMFSIGVGNPDVHVEFKDSEMRLVQRMMNTENWQDVEDLSKDLYQYCKDNDEEIPEDQGQQGQGQQGQGQGQGQEGQGQEGQGQGQGQQGQGQGQGQQGQGQNDPNSQNQDQDSDGSSSDKNENIDTCDASGNSLNEKDQQGQGQQGQDQQGQGQQGQDQQGQGQQGQGQQGQGQGAGESNSNSGKPSIKGGGSSAPATGGGTGSAGLGTGTKVRVSNFKNGVQSKIDEHLVKHKTTNSDFVYINIPEVDSSKYIIPSNKLWEAIDKQISTKYQVLPTDVSPREIYNRYAAKSRKIISGLVTEFNVRKSADESQRTSTAETGRINPNKLHHYKYDDNIFLRGQVVREGKNHGFVMIIDGSGSMDSIIGSVVEKTVELATFCRQVNVPFEVMIFNDNTYAFNLLKDTLKAKNVDINSSNGGYLDGKPKDGDCHMSNCIMLNVLSSKMSAAQFTAACGKLLCWSKAARNYVTGNETFCSYDASCMKLNGTPLNESILVATDYLPKFQKDNKVQIVNLIVLTDGEGNENMTSYRYDSKKGNYNYHYGSSGNLIARDNKCKISANLATRYTNINCSGYASRMTAFLIDRLKYRTGANAIGYYVGDRSFMKYRCGDTNKLKKLYDDYDKNGSAMILENGYDAYFIMSYDSLNKAIVDETGNLANNKTLSAEEKLRLISSEAAGNRGSRVFLTQFTNIVSGKAKLDKPKTKKISE